MPAVLYARGSSHPAVRSGLPELCALLSIEHSRLKRQVIDVYLRAGALRHRRQTDVDERQLEYAAAIQVPPWLTDM